MVLEKATQDEIKDVSGKINCQREDGEKQKIIILGKKLEGSNGSKSRDDLIASRDFLSEQKIGADEKTLRNFLEDDIKPILRKKKEQLDKNSKESKTHEAVQKFVGDIEKELKELCGNKNDKVALLQVYLNTINDVNGKHATIPYEANRYNYKQGEANRLFVDGILGPHTYNALWLVTFGEELPKTVLSRNQGYAFKREEPRIIGRDLPYIPLILPSLDKNGNLEFEKKLEIIDNPQIKGSIELLYLFYDGVAQKENISIDIDDELMKIMTDPKLYDDKKEGADPLDGYKQAIKQLNIKLAGENKKLNKGRDIITGFINVPSNKNNPEYEILATLENDIGAHEYVAEYIASQKIDLSKEPYKSKMEAIQIDTKDKDLNKYKKEVDKKWIEQKSAQEKFMLDVFNNAKSNATTPELKAELCQMFGVDSVDDVTPNFIINTVKDAIKVAEEDFRSKMEDAYFTKKLLEDDILSNKSQLNKLGNYKGNDKMLALFADIQGIGAFDTSSENKDTILFISQMVAEEAACFAIGALTAGAGGILLKTALYGKRIARITRLANAVNRGSNAGRKISKINQVKNMIRTVNLAEKTVRAERAVTFGGKAINVATFAAKIGVEGVGFYQATNAMQNVMHGKPTFEGRDNIPENIKSVAMMGALRFVNGLVATPKIVARGGKEFNINPFNKLSVKNTDKIFTKIAKVGGESLVGGTAIFTVEHMGDVIIEEDEAHPWTKEEFIQAVLMYMLFRGMGEIGNLKMAKNKKTNKPEIQKEDQKALPPHPEQKALPPHPEQKALPPHIEKGRSIKEINEELKPINDRLKELNKNGEYNMTEGQTLRIQRDKLLIEKNKILENQNVVKESTQKLEEINKELNAERSKLETDYQKLYQEHINAKTTPEQTRLQTEITKNRTRANEIDAKLGK